MKTQTAKIVLLALTLAVGISYVSAASTWQAPSVAAPGGNTDVPINVGSNAQSKQGDFAVGAFLANLNSQILGNLTIGATSSSASLIIPKGASAGKVLTALDSTGAAVWATSTGGTGTSTGGFNTICGATYSGPTARNWATHQWSAGECSNGLPPASCPAAIKAFSANGGALAAMAFNAGETAGSGAGSNWPNGTLFSNGGITILVGDTGGSNNVYGQASYSCGGGSTSASSSATSSMKTWTDSVALAPNRTFTVTHGFTNKPLVKASLVKVAANNTNVDSDRDTFPVGTEIGIESFWQWPNSYDTPFTVTANGTTITLHVNATAQYFYGERDYFSIPTAKMANWRLKITAVGDTDVVVVPAEPSLGSVSYEYRVTYNSTGIITAATDTNGRSVFSNGFIIPQDLPAGAKITSVNISRFGTAWSPGPGSDGVVLPDVFVVDKFTNVSNKIDIDSTRTGFQVTLLKRNHTAPLGTKPLIPGQSYSADVLHVNINYSI